MKVKSVKIKNFRIFYEFTIDFNSNKTILIGKNDTGKSTLLLAIRKVLDYYVRRKQLTLSDSFNENGENIEIEILLDIQGVNEEEKSQILKYSDNTKELTIKFIGKYNDDISLYEEELIYGIKDEFKFSTNVMTPIDKILEVLYISPSFILDNNKREYFVYREKKDRENELGLTSRLKDEIESLNDIINDDETIIEMTKELSDIKSFEKIFSRINFKVNTKLDTGNIYKSLDVNFYDGLTKVQTIGDGKSKALALLLNYLTKEPNKNTIILLEEPENHLYPQIQREYSNLIDELTNNQSIVTTHSPHYINFNQSKEIIKLNRENDEVIPYSTLLREETKEDLGFLFNEAFSEMLFYESVLLVEGVSELYFYNYLKQKNKIFNEYCTNISLGIFSVNGIDFNPYRKFLTDLNIKIIIKTDNDIFKVPYKKELYRYAGFQRAFDYLNPVDKEKISEILNIKETLTKAHFAVDNKNNNTINDKMSEIIKVYEGVSVYISAHHQGFEQDFLEYIGFDNIEENITILRQAKLKNLHQFILENKVDVSFNDNNKNNVLVKFKNV